MTRTHPDVISWSSHWKWLRQTALVLWLSLPASQTYAHTNDAALDALSGRFDARAEAVWASQDARNAILYADASGVITSVTMTDGVANNPQNGISLFEKGDIKAMPSRDFLYVFFPRISQDAIDAFYDAWESLPDRHKENVENLFVNSLPSAQIGMILNFEKARTGESKLDQRNLASLAMLISQINDLIVFNETGAFPVSWQLPDALAQLKRTQGVSPIFWEMFGWDFEAQVQQIQDTAYAKYDAIIAQARQEQAQARQEQIAWLKIIEQEQAKLTQLRQANETLRLLLKI